MHPTRAMRAGSWWRVELSVLPGPRGERGGVRDPRHSLASVGKPSAKKNVTRCSACWWDLEGSHVGHD